MGNQTLGSGKVIAAPTAFSNVTTPGKIKGYTCLESRLLKHLKINKTTLNSRWFLNHPSVKVMEAFVMMDPSNGPAHDVKPKKGCP
ncbi:hypothetical protein [Halobacillus campisalis]|uniref:Uncharacterized protein n=1 Tax=Halobacillus campisalis TaxID=435909 RepID=A0ABW2K832_9BACI|nr:hypothetical protein [Halobacillus campisalis]